MKNASAVLMDASTKLPKSGLLSLSSNRFDGREKRRVSPAAKTGRWGNSHGWDLEMNNEIRHLSRQSDFYLSL